jgi:hypothetical protein
MQADGTARTISGIQPKAAPLRLLCQPTVLLMPPASSFRSPWHCKQELRCTPSACKRRTEAQCEQSQRSPATSGHGCGRAPPRRAALLAAAFAGLAACSGSPEAAAAGLSAGQAAAVQRAAGVVPALPPSSYLRLIAAARPAALRALSAQVPWPGRLCMSPPCHDPPGATEPVCEPVSMLDTCLSSGPAYVMQCMPDMKSIRDDQFPEGLAPASLMRCVQKACARAC